MKTLLSVLPRFVLPDNTVVLPEEIQCITLLAGEEALIQCDNGFKFLASSARQDNATGHMAGEQMIYENDILNGSHVVYFEREESQWRVGADSLSWFDESLAWFAEDGGAIITGRVPYGEES